MQFFRIAGMSFLVLFLFAASGTAQFSGKPSPVIDTIPGEIYRAMNIRLQEENSAIKADKSKVRSFIRILQNERFKYIVKMFNDDKVMVNTPLNDYLNKITNAICATNPELPRDISVYIDRNNTANATSYGEGTILISLALLTRLENDHQVAFVICHELAHYYLGHSREAIYRYAELNFDKNLTREAREIRRSSYGNYTRMRDFMKSIQLGENKHSHTKEFEADEAGLKYFLKSPYADDAAPLRTMHILDSVDHEIYSKNLDLKKHFDLKTYPFKDSWLTYRRADIWKVKKDETDTAHTHPDCLKRAAALSRQLVLQDVKNDYTPAYHYELVRRQAKVDLIEANYHFEKYGRALFDALVLSEEFPKDVWLHAMIGRCLFQLHKKQLNHELGKALEVPGQKHDENYDRFLSFVHQLRLSELEGLTYHYMINQRVEYFEDEDFLYTLWLCSQLKVSKLQAASVEEDYREKFPDGKYLILMK